jgi:hypothetical protein
MYYVPRLLYLLISHTFLGLQWRIVYLVFSYYYFCRDESEHRSDVLQGRWMARVRRGMSP